MRITELRRDDAYNVHQFEAGHYDRIPVPTVSEEALMQGEYNDMRILLTPITISFVINGSHRAIFSVDVGYPTDWGSVPKKLRGLVDNDDIKMRSGFLCHDLLYNLAGSEEEYLSFEVAQAIMREVAIANGASKWTAWKAWFATRLFSRKLWNRQCMFDREAALFGSVEILEV